MNMKDTFRGYCCDGDISFTSDFTKIGKSLEGINNPDKVTFRYKNHDCIGYLKWDKNEFNNNSLEFVLYQISNVLQIDLAKTIRLFSDSSHTFPIAIVSIDVADDTNKKFISFREMRDELYIDLQNQIIPHSQWINNWSRIRARKNKNALWDLPVLSDSEYVDCLKFPVEIARLWCDKHGLELQDFYFSLAQMVCFDILIGQSDRSPSNYGLLVNFATQSAKLAPLFDNATIIKPYIDITHNSFNQLILERQKFAAVSRSVLGEDFKSIVKSCSGKKHEIYEMIKKLKNQLTQETYSLLIKRIEEGINMLVGES